MGEESDRGFSYIISGQFSRGRAETYNYNVIYRDFLFNFLKIYIYIYIGKFFFYREY